MNKEQEKILDSINKIIILNKKKSLNMANIEINNILEKDVDLKNKLENKFNNKIVRERGR